MNHDTQKFIDLRLRIMKKESELNNLKIPSSRISKMGLRTGLMGRVQRKENARFLKEVKIKKLKFARDKAKIDKYLQRVESIPTPKITLAKSLPKLRKIRGRLKKQTIRRKKR